MAISRQITAAIEGSSMIRRMFEEGARLTALHGADKVFDFSIGNPIFEPPKKVNEILLELIQSDEPGTHRYMPNAGYPQTRSYVADKLSAESGLSFEMNDVIMCVGAGGGLNVLMRTLLNPGEEVLVFTPYFVEYDAYAANHGGIIGRVPTNDDFSLNLVALEAAISANTRIVLINSPNNPTGVIYPAADLKKLGEILKKKGQEFGQPITLISDEPYKKITFEEEAPSMYQYYENCIVVTSHSKDLAIPGERIGYIGISPQHEDRNLIREGAVIALRTLGFVNAPALMQRLLPKVGTAMVDIEPYRKNRDLLYNHLTKIGFSCVKPGGGFYLFPKSPIEDDKEFIRSAQEFNLLLVPGSAFGAPGFFRIAFCFETEMIERSLPVFTKLAKQYQLG